MSAERTTYREAVATLAAKARETLPESGHRVDYAVKLVLSGDVTLGADGEALVGSATDPLKTSHVNGTCECRDFAQAPGQWCQHRIARALAIRLSRALPPVPETPAVQHREAPCSVNCHVTIGGRDVLVTLRGEQEGAVLARLERLLEAYPIQTSTATAVPTCPYHGPLKPSTKGKGFYCPGKMANGSYCTEKGGTR